MRIATGDAWTAKLLESTYAPLQDPRAANQGEEIVLPNFGEFGAAFYALRDIFARFAAGDPAYLALYGAAVGLAGRGAIIIGPAAIGKTILALNMAYLGADFLGDETALIDAGAGTLSAVPRRPALREPGLAYLLDEALRTRIARSPDAHDSQTGRFWYGVDCEGFSSQAALRKHPLNAVFLLAGRSAVAKLEPLTLPEILSAVARRLHGGKREITDIARLHALLRNARGYRVHAGPPEETARLVMQASS